MINQYTSARGHPLVYYDTTEHRRTDVVILTVENYCKWYGLFLVHPDGRVEEVPFPDDAECTDHFTLTPYVDHVPNPVVVARYAKVRGYQIDSQSLEMMVGRWQIEVKDEGPPLD